jgi:hypothetical protein
MPFTIQRPTSDEYAPFYAGYIQKVPEGKDIFELLTEQISVVKNLLWELPQEQANFRYAPEQWSVKEVLGHVCDAERVFAYRALRISRNDTTPLPSFDQDLFVRESNYSTRDLNSLVEEFELLRRANLLVFKDMTEEVSIRCGTASDKPVSVRALLYMMVGHVNQHLESLHTEYLNHFNNG